MNPVIQKPSRIIMYTTEYCSDCFRAKKFFESNGIEFDQVKLEENPEAAGFVTQLNGGLQSVPTIIFPDGSILVEPTLEELKRKISAG